MEGAGGVGAFAGTGDAAGLFLVAVGVLWGGEAGGLGGGFVAQAAAGGEGGEGGGVQRVGVVVVVGGGGAHVEGGEVEVRFLLFDGFEDRGAVVFFWKPGVWGQASEVGEAVLTAGEVVACCWAGDFAGGRGSGFGDVGSAA